MKALPSPFPLATRELRAYLEERAEQHAFRAAELLNLYDKFLKKHHHPAKHQKPARYIKLAAKETMKAELCRMTLAGLAVDAMKPLPDDVQEAIMNGRVRLPNGSIVVADEMQPFGQEEFEKAKAVLNGSTAVVDA